MKLVLDEPEREPLRRWLSRFEGTTSSALLHVESIRACARYGGRYVEIARDGLGLMALVGIDEPVVTAAAELGPPPLRSLDAIHLATALTIGADIGTVVTYDDRLHDAVVAAGLPAARPGRLT